MKENPAFQKNSAYKLSTISTGLGLFFLVVSQLLLSFGFDFLMAQRPIDFAHWALFLAALLLFGLWYCLPNNPTKNTGLTTMTLGIGGITGMCCIDFILWSAYTDPDFHYQIFRLISENASINIPFLIVGPTFFYMGIGIATYGLYKKYRWQVVILNFGLIMIGLGHMIFHNRIIPVFGALFLFSGLISIILINNRKKNVE